MNQPAKSSLNINMFVKHGVSFGRPCRYLVFVDFRFSMTNFWRSIHHIHSLHASKVPAEYFQAREAGVAFDQMVEFCPLSLGLITHSLDA